MMDLKLIRIADANTDDERIVIKALSKCNLNNYILFDTTFDESGIVSNRHRHMFVFPDLMVEKGDFVWLYTRGGSYGTHKNKSKTTTHKLYWCIDGHVWNNDGDMAYLLHYDDWQSLEFLIS